MLTDRYLLPLLSLLLVSLTNCGEEPAPAPEAQALSAAAVDSMPAEAQPAPYTEGEVVTAWVDGLFVRAQPQQGSEIVTQVAANTPLTYTGEASEAPEVLMLRGVVFEEPWLQVRTATGEQGWVYGGAVQRRGEERGDGYRSATRFAFPHFGTYDLTGWKQLPGTEASTENARRVRSVYEKDDQRLAIQRTEVGRYGYETNYVLTNTEGKERKVRTLVFEVEPRYRLIETVTDYTLSPPIRYRRSQLMPRHYSQLDAVPEMATGEWTEVRVGEE